MSSPSTSTEELTPTGSDASAAFDAGLLPEIVEEEIEDAHEVYALVVIIRQDVFTKDFFIDSKLSLSDKT